MTIPLSVTNAPKQRLRFEAPANFEESRAMLLATTPVLKEI
jgi:hypothetical protein